ncbi:MAG TPA: TRAP transporter substrate-binding protein [Bordetella sp.]|nr:TRAP transporter substrate-binding protein [Bordetella sp.]
MKQRALCTSLLSVVLTLGATSAPAQERWDLPTGYPPSNFQTQNLSQFVADIANAPGVSLKITLHPNASLFKLPEIKRAVQSGQVQIGEFSLLSHENEWPIFGADSQPFLATGYDSAMKLYQAQKPFLEKKLAQQGMQLLYAVPWPPQGLYSVKPIDSVEDFRRAKFRSYSPSTSYLAQLVHAQPVTVQAAELTQALATGVVEVLMTSPNTGVDAKFWETVKYFYDVQGWLPKNVVVVNKKAFDALDKTTQDAILKAAAEAEVRGWAMSVKENKQAIDTLRANGMIVAEPSPDLKEGLQEVGNTILEQWSDKAGNEGRALLQEYRKP